MSSLPRSEFNDPLHWQALAREHPLALLVFETPPQPLLMRLPVHLHEDEQGLWAEGHLGAGMAQPLRDGQS